MEHDNRRKRSQVFSYFLVSVVVLMFLTILGSLVYGKLSDIEETAMIAWGGALIGALGSAINYEWGSSKGSTLKDEVAAANSGNSGGKPASVTVTTNPGAPSETTVKTETTTQSGGGSP